MRSVRRGDLVNLAALDLNLVPALRALLEERNVTRAVRRVGLSRPAMSAAAPAKLRRHFGDELLVHGSGPYELTPLGMMLLNRTTAACDLLELVFGSRADFDPATEERRFTLLASDYAVTVFGAAPAREVLAEAPGVLLRFQRPPDIAVAEEPATVLSTVEGGVSAAWRHLRFPVRRRLPGPRRLRGPVGVPGRRRQGRRGRRGRTMCARSPPCAN